MSKAVKFLWTAFIWGLGLFILLLLLINWGVFGKLPSLAELENPSLLSSSEIYASDGTLMGKYYLKDRTSVPYNEIAPTAIKALIATEDERFYQHSGIDPKSLARAIVYMGKEGGASTITQQLAKAMLNQGSTNKALRIIEKLKEWIVALKLERNFTKEEILALYLNTVSYGDEIYGIRNAARTYFQKDADRLSIEESAVLIGLLKGNTKYNPRRNPKAALERRNTVLDQMVRNDFLASNEADALKLKPIQLNYKKLDENAGLAPYFREILRDEMKQWCKANKNPKTGKNYDIYRDGLKIYTTINPRMQLYAELAVARHMQSLQRVFNSQPQIKSGSIWKSKDGKAVLNNALKQSERWKSMKEDGFSEEEIRASFEEKIPMKVFAWNQKRMTDTVMSPLDSIKYHKQMMQTGFMAMDPLTGEVKAWVGGIDFKTFKFDHVNIETRRQVGSSFKPILYSLAVQNGYTPQTVLPGGPIKLGDKMIKGSGGPMAVCLAYSKNPAAVYLINQVGVQSTVDFAKECGITSKIPPYPSIALGSAEISLIEMVRSFTMFPGRGFNTKPVYISRIEDRNGNVLQQFNTERKEVLSENDAYTMTRMMQGVVDFGTARAIRGAYGIQAEAAGKTGTTNDNADGWFIGYTPQLLTGVWAGCDDPFLRLEHSTGGAQMAMPAWAYFYNEVFKDKTLGIDAQAKFIKPETQQDEIILDYQSLTDEPPPPAEGEDVGQGNAEDYIEVPVSSGNEEVSTESELSVEEKKILEDAQSQQKKPTEPVKDPATEKKPIAPSATDPGKDKKKPGQKPTGG